MTDIDFPSHIVHLDVLNDMVKNYQFIYLTKSDIERILPFVRKSQEVETLLSNFVLEHYNSIDKNERSLSGTIIERFRPLRGFLNVTLMGERDQIDNLNKSIKLLHDHIVYTIETYDSTGISLPHPKPIVNKSASVVNKPQKVVNEAKKATNKCEIDKNSTSEGGEWDGCFDDFLHPSLNPQAIAEALNRVNHNSLPKNKRSYWWVFVTVLTEIHWIKKTNYKTILKWANLHFNCGWDWKKEYQFKFSDISKKIKSVQPSSRWNKEVTGNAIGDYYGELAKVMKDTFVVIVNGNKLLDRKEFILPRCSYINNGRK